MAIRKATFKFGLHPHDMKHLTRDIASTTMSQVAMYFVSLGDHIGKPATPIVSKGDIVRQGQKIGESSGFVSTNVFSPIYGEVMGVVKKKDALGAIKDYVQIKALEQVEGDENCSPLTLSPMTSFEKTDILGRIQEAGIIGLGGAGFPSHVKLSPSMPVDTLLINCAECEPYITCDFRLLLEKSEEVAEGIKLLAKSLGVDKIILGIEENKPELFEIYDKYGFELVSLKTKYPQGAEKMLVYACTKRKIPNRGALPFSVGVVVQNPATAFAVYEACVLNTPLYKRMLTLSGEGFDTRANVWVLNGTPHQDIFNQYGLNDKTAKLVSGGPMMGFAITDNSVTTTKAESALLALSQDETDSNAPTNCISCGKCAEACPMYLMPMLIDFHTLAGNYGEAEKYGAVDCMSCGCCSYICPAKRPLVATIKLAKIKIREGK